MKINVGSIRRGGALVKCRGAKWYHRGALELPLEVGVKEHDVMGFGIGLLTRDVPSLAANFRPAGTIENVQNLVNWYAAKRDGDWLNIETFALDLDPTEGTFTTASAHLLSAGDEVMLYALGTLPSALDAEERYYVRTVDSPTMFTLKDSTGTAVAFADAGEGVFLAVARTLTVHTFDGIKITYYCAAPANLGSVNLTAGDTMLEQIGFRFYVRPGQDTTSLTGAYYKIEYEPFTDVSFDPAGMRVESPVLTWAFGAPWSTGLSTRAGAKLVLNLRNPDDLASDAFGDGQLAQIFRGIDVQLTASPTGGLTEAHVHAALQLEDAVRGATFSGGGALTLATPSLTVELADAALVQAPMSFDTAAQRMGDFVWRVPPTFTAGVLDPAFELTLNE